MVLSRNWILMFFVAVLLCDHAGLVPGQEPSIPPRDETTSPADQPKVEPDGAKNTDGTVPAGQESNPVDIDQLLNRAGQAANARQQFELKYKLPKGTLLRWQVEHTATTKTHMANQTEEMSSRSQSVRCWKILSVDSKGNMVFEHSIESMEAWEKIGDAAPIAYNSLTDKTPPPEYEAAADKIGKTLATFTVAPTGQIVNRQSNVNSANLGMGDVLIPMPDKPISIGHKWHVPTKFTAENDDGEMQQFAARMVYELDKVVDGKAYLTFKIEILTPLESEKAKSQLLQQLSRGVAVFDLEKGYVIQRDIEWNDKVQGFEGPDSYLSYIAKLNERQISEPARTGDLQPKTR